MWPFLVVSLELSDGVVRSMRLDQVLWERCARGN